jgi:hypothetical protein
LPFATASSSLYIYAVMGHLKRFAAFAKAFRESAERASAALDCVDAKVKNLAEKVQNLNERLARLEEIIEVTGSDGATLRIARDPENKP